jgi:hypothetical protein
MATAEEILAVFGLLRANYHHALRDMTAEQISDLQVLWCELLRDVDGELLRAAALQHASTSKWFPTVAELREAAADIVSPNHRMTAMEAWGEVARQIRSVGSWGKPRFTSPLICRLVDDMGWLNLCTGDMPGADRARFIEGYNALLLREKRETMELPQVTDARRRFLELAEQKRLGAPKKEKVSDA